VKIPSVHELRQELQHRSAEDLLEYCLRLARFKQENKELLAFLLFESGDMDGYLNKVKDDITLQFEEVNKIQLYFAKKNLRRILRQVNKQIRYTGSKQVEVELLLHFCLLLTASGIEIRKSTVIWNILKTQIKKIEKTLSALHDALQYDYQKEMKSLVVWK
jgi:hypothetical protein